MNITLQKFISRLVKTLKEENELNRNYDATKQPLDIPFIISTLSQSFENNEEEYKEFITDLELWDKQFEDSWIAYTESGYGFLIENPSDDDCYGIVNVSIYSNYYDDYPKYTYQLRFSFYDCYWGYCECTPDMPDYREDKQCCGHGCDSCFCSFTLNKVTKIASASWRGDAHDYWEFEDAFYKDEPELLKEKEKRRKESEIERLKNDIEYAKEKLAELEREYYEDRID